MLGRLHDAVTELITLPLATLTGDDVLALLRELQTERNRLATAEHALIAKTDSRGTAHQHACPHTANLLTQLLRGQPGSGPRASWDRGGGGPGRGWTGKALPPLFAPVAAAQASVSSRRRLPG